MKNSYAKPLTLSAFVAAMYVALTVVSSVMGLSGGIIQLRLSEMLCILPMFIPSAVFGLTLGCFIANLVTGAIIWDVIFGTVATLIGAVGAYLLRGLPKGLKWLGTLPTVIANALIIPAVLCYAYEAEEAFMLIALSVLIGEAVSAGALGTTLYYSLEKTRLFK